MLHTYFPSSYGGRDTSVGCIAVLFTIPFSTLHALQARSLTRPDGTASSSPRLAATVTDPKTGRTLDVLTTAPGMQFYTGNFLNGKGKGKGGAKYGKHGGFCLETQGFPDAVNQPNFPSVVIQPGETYRHEVVYKWHYSPLTSSSGNLAHTRSP